MRNRIARRLFESATAIPRMTMIPATPSSLLFMKAPPPRRETLPDHPLRSGCYGFVQQFERLFRSRCDKQLPSPARRNEAARGRMVHEVDEPVPVAADVQEAKRLLVIAERVPAPRIEKFVERSNSAREREEGVGELGHLRLALVHGLDDVEFGDAWVGDLDVDQRLRDDAINEPAHLEDAVGDHPHEAEPSAAVHQLDLLLDHRCRGCPSSFGERWVGTGGGTAVNRKLIEILHRFTDSLRSVSGRAPKCEITSAAAIDPASRH